MPQEEAVVPRSVKLSTTGDLGGIGLITGRFGVGERGRDLRRETTACARLGRQ